MSGPIVGVTGLQSAAAPRTTLPGVQWAIATGTTDIITAAYTPQVKTISDGMILGARLTATNTTTTPTFNADGTGAHTIVKQFNEALEPGDLPAEALFRFSAVNNTWEIVNPATMWREVTEWAVAGGSADAITATYTPAHGTLRDGMLFGVRAAAANATTAPTFAPDTQPSGIIYKWNKAALLANDIRGANHEIVLRLHVDTVSWYELMNPSTAYPVDPTFGVAFVELTSDAATLANDTSAHAIVGLGVTLGLGQYQVNGKIHTTRAAGTTSHSTKFLLGGTATLSDARFVVRSRGADAQSLAAVSSVRFESAAALVVKAASTSATEDVDLEIEGTVTVTVAGTILPSLQYDIAPGGVTTPKAGCQFTFTPRTNPQGTWA